MDDKAFLNKHIKGKSSETHKKKHRTQNRKTKQVDGMHRNNESKTVHAFVVVVDAAAAATDADYTGATTGPLAGPPDPGVVDTTRGWLTPSGTACVCSVHKIYHRSSISFCSIFRAGQHVIGFCL
jgi:hypothetical protein